MREHVWGRIGTSYTLPEVNWVAEKALLHREIADLGALWAVWGVSGIAFRMRERVWGRIMTS